MGAQGSDAFGVCRVGDWRRLDLVGQVGVVEGEKRSAAGKVFGGFPGADDAAWAGIARHECEACLRIVRIERQVGGACLEDGQQTNHQVRAIKPYARYGEKKLRFNWNTPIQVSPTDKNTLYLGAQYLYRSRDKGQSWDRISPDLTTTF